MKNTRANKKILVIGDSCKDIFIYGSVNRICPEAPVPVFVPHSQVETGGMAANVYENLISLKCDVDIITNEKPAYKTRYVEERTNHMIVRVDTETSRVGRIQNLKEIEYSKYDFIIISDYNKGFLTYDDIEYICNIHPYVFIDTKKIINNCFLNAFCIKINEIEYNNTKNAGYDLDSHPSHLIVTTGNKGCKYKNKNFPVLKVDVKDMSGAGDTFIASMVSKFLKTYDIEESLKYANYCATIVVQHKGIIRVGDFL